MTPENKPRGGSGEMFDRIAGRYDLLNRVISLGTDASWRRAAVTALALRESPRVLDLATGTADVALAIAARHPDARVVGVDPSQGMLEIGRRKVEDAGVSDRVELVPGDAQALALADNSFDGVVIAFGLRNVPDRPRALREMARVLRTGARVVVLELGEPRGGALAGLARFHVHTVVPRLGALLSGAREYAYLQRSIEAFPPPPEVARAMEDAGLSVVEIRPLTFGAAHLFVGEKREAK